MGRRGRSYRALMIATQELGKARHYKLIEPADQSKMSGRLHEMRRSRVVGGKARHGGFRDGKTFRHMIFILERSSLVSKPGATLPRTWC